MFPSTLKIDLSSVGSLDNTRFIFLSMSIFDVYNIELVMRISAKYRAKDAKSVNGKMRKDVLAYPFKQWTCNLLSRDL